MIPRSAAERQEVNSRTADEIFAEHGPPLPPLLHLGRPLPYSPTPPQPGVGVWLAGEERSPLPRAEIKALGSCRASQAGSWC